jgi:hypothetical protein
MDAVEGVQDKAEGSQKSLEDYVNSIDQWLGHLQGVMGQASSLMNTYQQMQQQQLRETMAEYDRRMEKMEESHERELSYAEERGASEKELQAIRERQEQEQEQLEQQRREKRKEAERKAFQRQKAVRIANTTMAGAQATIGALAGPDAVPFPVKLGFAATVAAMTAAQIGMISSQQYPGLAEGGIVPAQGETGGLYRLGDKGKTETVLPYDIREQGVGGNTVNINGRVEMYGAGGKDEFIRDIHRAIRRGRATKELV